jgi:crotonobetainyl-CoA:carnitine CoA-transferase CaiB-like acyl-CoA transferase
MPLSPFRVLDLTDDRGQYAGFLLAQLGADVICIEPPEGQRSRRLPPFLDDEPGELPGDRSLFHWAYNRGKRSAVVDHGGLQQLAQGADILIECGAFDVDLAGLRAANPALITATISPFGEGGPKADWLATDLIVNAAGGVLSVTGDKDRPPVRNSHPQSWLIAAGDATAGVLVALRERRHSGLGQHVSVSAQASMISCAQFAMMNSLVDVPSAKRIAGGLELGPFKLRFVYECADGHVNVTYLFGPVIGPYSNRLFQWMHAEGECDESLATKNWINFALDVIEGRDSADELDRASEAIEAFMLTRTKADLLREAMERNVLIAPITTTRDLLDLDHLAAREYFESIAVPGRESPVAIPGPFARLSGSPTTVLGPPPVLGAHTAELLAESPRQLSSSVESVSPTSGPAAADAGQARRPLEGLKVLDLFWALAGPGATRTLADFGATVVRVESETRPELLRSANPFRGDDGEFEGSLQYHSSNAGKMHLQLNLAVPESRQVLMDMVAWADVVTQSFTPRAMRKMELTYETLRKVNPGIIMVSSCLMGDTGPLSDYPGFGTAGASFAGFYPIVGWPDRLPSGPYTAYTDYVSPRTTIAALLAALEYRDRTGEGQHIDYSQMEAAMHLISPLLFDDALHDRTAGRDGNADRVMVPHTVVRTAPLDGDHWIAIACETDQQWESLAALLDRTDLAGLTTSERHTRSAEIGAVLSEWTATQSAAVLEASLQSAGVPAHQVQNSVECVADPQLVHRGHFQSVPHSTYGDSFVESAAFDLSRTPGAPRWAGPTMGEHTFEILAEFLGYDSDRIADLAVAGCLT